MKNELESYYKYFNFPTSDERTIRVSQVDQKIKELNREIEEKEEQQKRELREKLFKIIRSLIWAQLIFFDMVVILILLPIIFRFSVFANLNDNTISLLLNFLKYFIGATIVELLGMLLFVVKFVFTKYNSRFKKNV